MREEHLQPRNVPEPRPAPTIGASTLSRALNRSCAALLAACSTFSFSSQADSQPARADEDALTLR
jgi:hypothetical protein